MKILYIAPENIVGNLNLWKKIHEDRGHSCRYITYYPSTFGFPDDICLNLPLIKPSSKFLQLRKAVYNKTNGPTKTIELEGNPPVWSTGSVAVKGFFKLRDILWRLWIEPNIRKYDLLDFDIYHLETGLEFYRNGDFVRRIHNQNKPIFNIFHGVELRHRGVIQEIDKYITLNFTSELDLLDKHPNIKYLHLPFDVNSITPKSSINNPVTICHATRNRYFKGSDKIIAICEQLVKEYGVKFILIENRPHQETMELKQQADIYIDQINNVAPGYGMNSIEAMSMGQVCLANIDENYRAFMPDHPFVHVTPNSLKSKLKELISLPDEIISKGKTSRDWVEKHHSLEKVGDQLYNYYRESGVENI